MKAFTKSIKGQLLYRSIQDLERMSIWPGLFKFSYLLLLSALAIAGYFTAESVFAKVAYMAASILFYGPLLILTHDAIHHTLTGNRILDEVLPRIVSIVPLWWHGTYSEIHKIHHKMNGTKVEDPESTHWTLEQYNQAGPLKKFYYRNQFYFRVFVFGGFGFYYAIIRSAIRFFKKSKGLRRQVFLDAVLIFGGNALLLYGFHQMGMLLEYIVFFLVFQLFTGGLLQFRNFVEHHGLWGKQAHTYETQFAVCRNIKTNAVGKWVFNGLNYHSMHHAFPKIPFYNLEEAHHRIKSLYAKEGVAFPEYEGGYWKAFSLAAQIGVIQDASKRVSGHFLPLAQLGEQKSVEKAPPIAS